MVDYATNRARLDRAAGINRRAGIEPLPFTQRDQTALILANPDLTNQRDIPMAAPVFRGVPTGLERVGLATQAAQRNWNRLGRAVADMPLDAGGEGGEQGPRPMIGPMSAPTSEDVAQGIAGLPGAALGLARDAAAIPRKLVFEHPWTIPTLAAELSGVLPMYREATGAPGYSGEFDDAGDAAWMAGDDDGAGQAYGQAIKSRLQTATPILLAGTSAIAMSKAAGGAGLLEAGQATRAAEIARRPIPGMKLPDVATVTGLGAGASAVAFPAFAGTPEDDARSIEDRYVREAKAIAPPFRPDAGRAHGAGYAQGFWLNNYDDWKRDPAKIAERDRLRAEWNAGSGDGPERRDLAARIMRAEYEADPIGYEAATNPQSFNDGRFLGEATMGGGTAILSTLAGIPLRNQTIPNAIAGLIKGAAYGYGSEEGDKTQDERRNDAIKDALISMGVSAAMVPAFKKGAELIDEFPRADWKTLKIDKTSFPPRPHVSLDPNKARLGAPVRLRLKDGMTPLDAIGYAQHSDTAREGRFFESPPIMPRLDALIDKSPEGRLAQVEASKSTVRDTANDPQKMPPPKFQGPITNTAHAVSMQMIEPDTQGLGAWRALSENQQNMAAEALRQRLAKGLLSPEEQSFLRSKKGLLRLQEYGLIDLSEKPNDWADLIKEQAEPYGNEPVNTLRNILGGQAVPPRLNPETAAALGEARIQGGEIPPPPPDGQQYSPGTFDLRDLFETEKTPGPKPKYVKPTAMKAIGEMAPKFAALALAIPATGAIDELTSDPKTGFKAPPLPMGADAKLRQSLALAGLNEDAAKAEHAYATAGETFDARRDQEIADANNSVAQIVARIGKLERTPAEVAERDAEGNVNMRDNSDARRAALARAEALKTQLQSAREAANALRTGRLADKARETGLLKSAVQSLDRDRATLTAR